MTTFEYHKAGNSQAQQDEALAYLLAQVSTGKAATGVLSGLVVSQTTTASGSVLVGSGAGVVQAATLDGAGLLVNDSQATVDVFTANPMSSLPRNDIIVLDRATTTVRVIVGTPAASPSDPTVPSSAIKLARLRNPASATTIPTANIDDLRTFTRLLGGRPTGTLYQRNTNFDLATGTESVALATVAPALTGVGVLKVTLTIPGFSATTTDCRVLLRVKDGAGTTIGSWYVGVDGATTNGGSWVAYTSSPTPAGNVTMTAQRVGGTGTVTIRGVEGWSLETSVL